MEKFPNPEKGSSPIQKYTFGDILRYTSPQNPVQQTSCVFIRDDNGRAVVFFQHAEWAARVNYEFLLKEDKL